MLTTTITPQTFSGITSPHATVMSFFPLRNYPTSSYYLSINKREKEFQTATTKAQEGNLRMPYHFYAVLVPKKVWFLIVNHDVSSTYITVSNPQNIFR